MKKIINKICLILMLTILGASTAVAQESDVPSRRVGEQGTDVAQTLAMNPEKDPCEVLKSITDDRTSKEGEDPTTRDEDAKTRKR